ncbi:hypothetical protein BSL78_13857 [Apostichopus japonicus]|uniref:Peptidase A2 domain-containing protein n=1 Tax=Stichopus japonicus TaxID=307972 RepID=A0A2G8KMK0_STIJA|nr:hypothetical protein BSL78_13857 [Apostichopus japonicus]
MKSLAGETNLPIHQVRSYNSNTRGKSQKSQTSSGNRNCYKCGRSWDREHDCPAIGAKCNSCGKLNHFAVVCRNNQKLAYTQSNSKKQRSQSQKDIRVINQATGSDTDSETEFFIGMTKVEKAKGPKTDKNWEVQLSLNECLVNFTIDTGAECNVISKSIYEQITNEPPKKSKAKLVAYGGQKLKTIGCVDIACEYKDRFYVINFQVVDGVVPCLLGLPSCEQLSLIKRVFKTQELDSEESTAELDLLEKYKDVFTGLGSVTDVTHHITVDPTIAPVVHPPRKVPVALRERIRKELNRMERMNVISRVREPTAWVNSMVTVIKPNKIRICIDPRDLNKAIKREHFPAHDRRSDFADARRPSIFCAGRQLWVLAGQP